MVLRVRSEGRKHFVVGQTYPYRGLLRRSGARWDPIRGSWWCKSRAEADEIVEKTKHGASKAR